MNNPKNRPVIESAAIGAFASTALIVATLTAMGRDEHGWLLAARYTARLSFLIFFVAFTGPGWLPSIKQNRHPWLAAFGAAHIVHLGALITYRAIAGKIPPPDALAVGGLGYLLLAALLFFIVRGSAPRRLEAVALHYLLGVFLLTYALKIPTTDQHWPGIIGSVACGTALVVRHIPLRSPRKPEPGLQ